MLKLFKPQLWRGYIFGVMMGHHFIKLKTAKEPLLFSERYAKDYGLIVKTFEFMGLRLIYKRLEK